MQFKVTQKAADPTLFTLEKLLAEKPDGVYVNTVYRHDVLIISNGVVVNFDGPGGGLGQLLLEEQLGLFLEQQYTRVTTPITLEITA